MKPLVGPAGEHFVLYRQGMLASLAPPGTPTIDLLVLDYRETVSATVQVKTRMAGSRPGWVMGVKQQTGRTVVEVWAEALSRVRRTMMAGSDGA